jgi:hypothetical protein
MITKFSEDDPITNRLIETKRYEVAQGLRYTYNRANSNTAKLLEVSSFAYAAIEPLTERGLIDIEDLDQRKGGRKFGSSRSIAKKELAQRIRNPNTTSTRQRISRD